MRLSPNIKIHIQGFELWHVYQFVPTLKVIAATIKSEISHFVIYSNTFCSLCQRMSNIIQILISQCPGSVILLCEPVMGEVRSLFWLEEKNLWYWTEGKSHWCFPQGGLWRLEGFFFSVFSVVRRLRTGWVSLSNVLSYVCFADSLKWYVDVDSLKLAF